MIKVRAVEKQRYDTMGDWQFIADDLEVKVTDLGDERMNLALAIHEIVEAYLCKAHGISERDVDIWDLSYPKERGEPGEDVQCPYHNEHMIAQSIEYLVLNALGVSIASYERKFHGD
jgi:hypothetical protein